ncbi:phospholipase A [Paraferrimonas sedimenticola]|uniref:Phospholipase A1 n=1 Tax=Paraferrimonas sedimenticola TaxID=375674 RepID=A0AA37RVL5_9GAMM|nr:phospholipase A [Paraferrimonas sedimenticola]GLP95654.1 phospholipase [Paraferrimonas sedimenticola]
MSKRLLALLLTLACSSVFAAEPKQERAEQTEAVEQNEDDPSLLQQRIAKESAQIGDDYILSTHKVNYILPVTYMSRPNGAPVRDGSAFPEDVGLDNMEAKFQISFKLPVATNLFNDNGHLFVAYTNQSYWQVYNKEISSPFREINHEPEAFLLFNNDAEWMGIRNSMYGFGVVHQSNGRSQPQSRSWNRIYAAAAFDKGNLALAAKVWYRIPEKAKSDPMQPKGDDNPDIEDYLGNMELLFGYGLGKQRITMLLRNNLNFKDNRGAIEVNWSYPIKGNLRFYAQYFNGYGESLIDYNHHNQRIGIGLSVNDLF